MRSFLYTTIASILSKYQWDFESFKDTGFTPPAKRRGQTGVAKARRQAKKRRNRK